MKKIGTILLVVVIMVTVLFPVAYENLFDIKYMARVMQTLGANEAPDLFGGYDFSTFKDGSLAVLHIMAYPIKLVFYIVSQISLFIDMIGGKVTI